MRNFRLAFPSALQGLFHFLLGRHFLERFSNLFPYFIVDRRASKWGKGEAFPARFWKLKKVFKKDLGKNSLTVRIYRLSFSFNLSFSILRVSRSQNSNIFTCKATFLCVARQISIEMHWFQLFFTFTFSLNQYSK